MSASRACASCHTALGPAQAQCPRCGGAAHALPDPKSVPVVSGGPGANPPPLTSFETYLLSQVDGISNLDTLGHKTGLQTLQVQSALQSLADRGVVRFSGSPDAPPPRAVLGRIATLRVPMSRPSSEAPPPPPPPAPPSSQAPPLLQAVALESKGDLKGAIRVLEQALPGAAEPAPLYHWLAMMVLKDRNDLAQAESLLRKAVSLAPGQELYRSNLARILELSAKQARRG